MYVGWVIQLFKNYVIVFSNISKKIVSFNLPSEKCLYDKLLDKAIFCHVAYLLHNKLKCNQFYTLKSISL